MSAITIKPHDPDWLKNFDYIRIQLESILEDIPIIAIEHVGSTSVPGLVAKPVLDIDIVVRLEDLNSTRRALIAARYEDRGDLGVPERISFRQPISAKNTAKMQRNTYVVVDGAISLRNHRDFKNILLKDSELREEYGAVKEAIVRNGVTDIDEYCRCKNAVIRKILQKAGWTEEDLVEVDKANN